MAGERSSSDRRHLGKTAREESITMDFYLLINFRIVAIIQLMQSGFREKTKSWLCRIICLNAGIQYEYERSR